MSMGWSSGWRTPSCSGIWFNSVFVCLERSWVIWQKIMSVKCRCFVWIREESSCVVDKAGWWWVFRNVRRKCLIVNMRVCLWKMLVKNIFQYQLISFLRFEFLWKNAILNFKVFLDKICVPFYLICIGDFIRNEIAETHEIFTIRKLYDSKIFSTEFQIIFQVNSLKFAYECFDNSIQFYVEIAIYFHFYLRDLLKSSYNFHERTGNKIFMILDTYYWIIIYCNSIFSI